MVDTTIFRYIISLAVHERLDLHLMDVVTAYLYGSLDNDIYMKIPEGFKMLEACNLGSREHYSIKLNKFLYWLKQYRYENDSFCIFVKRYGNDFVMIAIYVERWNSWRASKINNLFKWSICDERF